MRPPQKNPVTGSPTSADAPMTEPSGAAPAPSFLYRLGLSIANMARSISQGFERLLAALFQRQTAISDANTHVEAEVGRTGISNPLDFDEQNRPGFQNVEGTVINPRAKYQVMVAALIAPTQQEQKAIAVQLFGREDSVPYIDAVKTYAICCVSNSPRDINQAQLLKAMQGLKKFIHDRGTLNPETKQIEPFYPGKMKEAGISEHLWKALVAMNLLYEEGFAIYKE